MQFIAWLSHHVAGAAVVFFGMLAVGLLLMPGALRWLWRALRRWW
jgi:hypothetical protein